MSTYDEQELVRLATEITALRARCEAAELALKEERRFAQTQVYGDRMTRDDAIYLHQQLTELMQIAAAMARGLDGVEQCYRVLSAARALKSRFPIPVAPASHCGIMSTGRERGQHGLLTLCTLLAGHTGTHYGVGGAGWNAEPVSPAGGQRTNSPTGGEHEGCALFSRVPALGVYRDCEGEGHYLCRECVHKEKLSGEEEP